MTSPFRSAIRESWLNQQLISRQFVLCSECAGESLNCSNCGGAGVLAALCNHCGESLEENLSQAASELAGELVCLACAEAVLEDNGQFGVRA